ncbi:MAG: nucleotidyltransferase domain-containing protein [Dehalococcoidia bacterium]|nr:nucleotidyltransferase domain-containing protein [Dehalococcoidia bacterium]
MAEPHVPGWLEDAVNAIVARHEAEAVFLVGSQARGHATPASDYDLLVLVDNASVARRGVPPRFRWQTLDGYPAPAKFLLSSVAELMAGLYSAGSEWRDLAESAHPLHDPPGYAPRITAQLTAGGSVTATDVLDRARGALSRARTAAQSDGELAALVTVRAADDLAAWAATQAGRSALQPEAAILGLRALGPGPERAFRELLGEPSVTALERLIGAIEASLRARGGSTS